MELFFPTLPDLVRTFDKAVLVRDYHFAINGVDLTIMKGFEWDGASIPKLMRWKYGTPFDPVHLVGGLVHDAIYADAVYDGQGVYLADFTRLKADNIYFALIRANGAVLLRAFKEWLAVVIFGWSHWTKR